MEHPNKWSATQTERWMPTTCTQCSVGCSIHLGTKRGKGVIARPDTHANPVSRDQVCVRGRFGYDAVKPAQRLSTPMIRRNGGLDASTWDEAMEFTAARLAQIREEHGPDAIGFLASPLATNEENYLLGKIARAIVGTNNVDSSAGPVARMAAAALEAAFGSEVLPADGTRVAQSKTLLVAADDLESSHNVYSLRAKDAVVRNGARLIVVSAMWGELNDFAEAFVQPKPGDEAAVLAALAEAADGRDGSAGRSLVTDATAFDRAVEVLKSAKAEGGAPFTAIAGLSNFGPAAARAIVGSLANIAMSLAGADAAKALLVLPQEANVWGMRDTGGTPDLLPGHRPATDEKARAEVRRVWGAEMAATPGKTYEEMLATAKALVVLNDNPLMLAPGAKLPDGVEFVAVIDSLNTDTAKAAHAVLPDAGAWASEGTTVSADRRVLRLNEAHTVRGDAQQGWRILCDLGKRLVERFGTGEIRINYGSAAEVMDEMAQVIPLFKDSAYLTLDSGQQQHIDGLGPKPGNRVSVQAARYANGHDGTFTLTASRGLYTSYEAAAVHAKDADLLHREDAVRMHPGDAAALGVADGDVVTVKNAAASFQAPVKVTAAVQPKVLWIASYFDGGAPAALFEAGSPVASVTVTRG
jgi:predicted molibdopterin-dependent oxidoreductase YjgC